MTIIQHGTQNPAFADFDFTLLATLRQHGRTRNYEELSADHGYKACWSKPLQSVIRSNGKPGQVQFKRAVSTDASGGQVECNFAGDNAGGLRSILSVEGRGGACVRFIRRFVGLRELTLSSNRFFGL
jgi:hypothetical protein